MTTKKNIHTIVDTRFNHENFEVWKKDYAECYPELAEKYGDDEDALVSRYMQELSDQMGDERMNLSHVELDGCIVIFVDMGLWDGRCKGSKVIGSDLSQIIDTFGCDDAHIFCDRNHVKADLTHHDGEHHVTYRLAKDEDEADKICQSIAYGCMTFKQFLRKTKSLRPYVAKVYGW